TTSTRDWSSDVCSSDLEPQRGDADGGRARRLEPDLPAQQRPERDPADAGEQPRALLPGGRAALRERRIDRALADARSGAPFSRRSEEHRVGKERRSVWW